VVKRLYGAKALPARRPVRCFSRKIANLNAREFDRPERIWIVTPCHERETSAKSRCLSFVPPPFRQGVFLRRKRLQDAKKKSLET